MESFPFQMAVQGLIIALVWVLVDRDVKKVQARHGATPANISTFAWGALCGLTWVALIPYFVLRRRVADGTVPAPERNLLTWWIVLALASAVWAASQLANDDANNGAQHLLLAGTFAVCGVIAWCRDKRLEAVQP